MTDRYEFDAEVWVAPGTGAWNFVSLPPGHSDEIADLTPSGPGFGAVRVEVTIGATTWRTSIFPDSTRGTYVLPVKKAVRTAEGLAAGGIVRVTLTLA